MLKMNYELTYETDRSSAVGGDGRPNSQQVAIHACIVVRNDCNFVAIILPEEGYYWVSSIVLFL